MNTPSPKALPADQPGAAPILQMQPASISQAADSHSQLDIGIALVIGFGLVVLLAALWVMFAPSQRGAATRSRN